MRTIRVVCILFCLLLISVVMATKYQLDAGPYAAKFNSTQELVVLPPLQHTEKGSHASGWDIGIQDNMSHSLFFIAIIEEDQVTLATKDTMDGIVKNNMARFTGEKPITSIKIDGINGRMIEAYNPEVGMKLKQAIYPFDAFYDSFYKQVATKCFILVGGFDLPALDEIFGSLNITKNAK